MTVENIESGKIILPTNKYRKLIQKLKSFKADESNLNKTSSEIKSNNVEVKTVPNDSNSETNGKNDSNNGTIKKVKRIRAQNENLNKKEEEEEILNKLTTNYNKKFSNLKKINCQGKSTAFNGSNKIQQRTIPRSESISESDSESSSHKKDEEILSNPSALHLKKPLVAQDIHDDSINYDFYSRKSVETFDWSEALEDKKDASKNLKTIFKEEKCNKLKKIHVDNYVDSSYSNYVQNSMLRDMNFEKNGNIKINHYSNEGEAFVLNVQRNLNEFGRGLVKVTEEAKQAFKGKKIKNHLMDLIQSEFIDSVTVRESQNSTSDFNKSSKYNQNENNSVKLTSENKPKKSKLFSKLIESYKNKNENEQIEYLLENMKTIQEDMVSSENSNNDIKNQEPINIQNENNDVKNTSEPKNIARTENISEQENSSSSKFDNSLKIDSCISKTNTEKVVKEDKDNIISLNTSFKSIKTSQSSAHKYQSVNKNNIYLDQDSLSDTSSDDENTCKFSKNKIETNNHSLALVPKQNNKEIIIKSQIQNDLTKDRIIMDNEDYIPSDEGFDIVNIEAFGIYQCLMQKMKQNDLSESEDLLEIREDDVSPENCINDEDKSTSNSSSSRNTYSTASESSVYYTE